MAVDKFLNAHAFIFVIFFFSWTTAFLFFGFALINQTFQDFILRPQIIGKVYRHFKGYSDEDFISQHECPRETIYNDKKEGDYYIIKLMNSIRTAPKQRTLLIEDLFLLDDRKCYFGGDHGINSKNHPGPVAYIGLKPLCNNVLYLMLKNKKHSRNPETLAILADWICQDFGSECLRIMVQAHDNRVNTGSKLVANNIFSILANPKTPRQAVFNNLKVLLERLEPYLSAVTSYNAQVRLDPETSEHLGKILLNKKVTQEEIIKVAGWPLRSIQGILEESPYIGETERVIAALTVKGNV